MKKYVLISTAIILLFCMSGCYYFTDPVIFSLPMYESRFFYSSDGGRDLTCYAKYTYANVDAERIAQSRYLKEVTANDIEEILAHIDDHESWVRLEGGEIEENYDFDKSIVSEGDFFYIKTKAGEPIGSGIYDSSDNYTEYTFDGEFQISYSGTYDKFDCYDLYYFDVEAQILYYFHNDL